MFSTTLVVISLTALAGAGAASDYSRTLSASALDQAAFDAETYGEKAGPEAGSRRAADDPCPWASRNRLEDAAANPVRRRLHDHGDRGHQDASQAGPGRRRGPGHGDRISGHQPAGCHAAASARAERAGSLSVHRQVADERRPATTAADANADATGLYRWAGKPPKAPRPDFPGFGRAGSPADHARGPDHTLPGGGRFEWPDRATSGRRS